MTYSATEAVLGVCADGTVTFDAAAGTTTYTPVTDFSGADSYTYTITDVNGDSSTATDHFGRSFFR